MAGHKPWRLLRNKLTPEQRAESDRLKKQFEEEMVLEQVREALMLTQQHLAAKLRTSQANVSKMEKRADMLLSTLAGYLHAMGVELELRARVPGVGSVRLKGLGQVRQHKAA